MELVYQYLWKHRLFGRELPVRGGGKVEVLSPGRLNMDAGPDFFNARLRFVYGEAEASEVREEWTGNVEIHVKASDWYRHGHHVDEAYDTVILHVVASDDADVETAGGRRIPTVLVSLPVSFYLTVGELKRDFQGVRCARRLPSLTRLEVADWIESLAMERLHMKAGRVCDLVDALGGDWRQAFFITFARGLGFGLNGVPFELLAKSIPMNFIGRHADQPHQIEALLFGQGGMLDPNLYRGDEYYQLLCREYRFLNAKYSLRPISRSLWKYSRTRPGNFPHRRIAYLATALAGGLSILDKILEYAGDEQMLRSLFSWQLGGYWGTHTGFGIPSGRGISPTLSRDSVTLLLINVVVPVVYAYGVRRGSEQLTEAAVSLLERLPAERNSLITQWNMAGLRPADAFRSQALIHLRREYCDADRCLDCRFAYHLLKRQTGVPEKAGAPEIKSEASAGAVSPVPVVREPRPAFADDIVESDYDVWAY